MITVCVQPVDPKYFRPIHHLMSACIAIPPVFFFFRFFYHTMNTFILHDISPKNLIFCETNNFPKKKRCLPCRADNVSFSQKPQARLRSLRQNLCLICFDLVKPSLCCNAASSAVLFPYVSERKRLALFHQNHLLCHLVRILQFFQHRTRCTQCIQQRFLEASESGHPCEIRLMEASK